MTNDADPSSLLWRLEPTRRFTERARDYARHRPGYPRQAIDAVLDGLGEPSQLHVADLGAGTGISSRLFAERGCLVTAVEPNSAMRGSAAPHPRVEMVEGTAERTGLPGGSVDAVICAQSFHWFEPGAALAEFLRVLRPAGRLAILWNERAGDDPFTAGCTRLLHETAHPTEARDDGLAEGLSSGFVAVRRRDFRHAQDLSLDGLLGTVLSASYAPSSGPDHERLVRGLDDLHSRFADASGRVRIVYATVLFLATAGTDRVERE